MLRLGFIGAGAIAEVHADAAVKAGSAIVGFCDAEQARARTLAERFGAELATSSLPELLSSDCQAVVIAVPNHLHLAMTLAAIEASKDVLLEKPMAMSVAECDAMIATAKRRRPPPIVMLNFVCRSAPASSVAKALVEQGRLGRIYHMKASIYRHRGIPGLGRWFTTKSAAGGGVLVDLGVHLIDLAIHLAGAPRVERASGQCTSVFGSPIERYRFKEMWAGPPRLDGVFDVEDGAVALLRLAGGVTFELNVTWAANVPEGALPRGMTLMGERGGCRFDIWSDDLVLVTEECGEPVEIRPPLPPAEQAWPFAWRRQHELFAEAVRTRREPEASMAAGRTVQAVLEAIYRSSDEGREVKV